MALTLGTGTIALATLGVATTLLISDHPESGPGPDSNDLCAPAVPQGIAAELVDSPNPAVALSWDENRVDPDLTGYIIYRSDRPEGGYRAITDQFVPTNHFVDTSPPAGRPCFYRIAARDASRNESALSGPAEVALLPAADGARTSPNVVRAGF